MYRGVSEVEWHFKQLWPCFTRTVELSRYSLRYSVVHRHTGCIGNAHLSLSEPIALRRLHVSATSILRAQISTAVWFVGFCCTSGLSHEGSASLRQPSYCSL